MAIRTSVSPGEILKKFMANRQISKRAMMGLLEMDTIQEVDDLLEGRSRIDGEVAFILYTTFGVSGRFWIYQQFLYDQSLKEARTRFLQLLQSR